jgi:hypothetical protein
MITKQKFKKGLKHFYDCINFGESVLDAEAVRFMNEAFGEVEKVLDMAPDLVTACKALLGLLGDIRNKPLTSDDHKSVKDITTKAEAVIAKAK